MDAQLESKLIECLSQLEDGEPLDRILARYPDDAVRLRPLLETASALEGLREEPSETARIASRRMFLAQAHQLRESASRQRFWLPRRMVVTIAVLAFVFLFVGGTIAASAVALPDEPLYGVKRAVEDAQLLVASTAQKGQLAARFEQRRRDEVNMLLAMRRDSAIAFEGTIDSIQPDGLDVSGLYLHIDRATTIAGTPAVGARARVQGRARDGQLFATFVSVEPGGDPQHIPPAQPTAAAVPTEIPSPAPSPAARPSPRPEVTQQPELAASPQPSPTSAPTRAPSATPRPPATRVPPTPVPPTPVPPTPVPPTPVPPAPEEQIEFGGTVEATGAIWTISGTRVETDGGTEIRGTIGIGDRVKVRARRLPDGRLIATRIEREDENDGGGGNDNANNNDNSNDNGNDSGGSNDNSNDNGDDHGGNDSGGNDSGGDHGGSGGGDGGGGNSGSGGGGGGGGGGDDKP
jgi:uncharacterized membrane protein YgcG